MSFPGQAHHPHKVGTPPNAHLIGKVEGGGSYIPEGLELVQAHWFVRHGERSPVRKRLAGAGEIPETFTLCAAGRQFATAVTTISNQSLGGDESDSHSFEGAVMKDRSFQVPEGMDRTGAAETKAGRLEVMRLTESMGEGNSAISGGLADCYWGELTDLGRKSTLNLGTRLRALYVDQLGFLPPTLPDLPPSDNPITFRSTGMPRTIESLHQVAEGLFPGADSRDGPVRYTVRAAVDESLYPNSLCARMRRLDRASADQVAKTYNPTLAPLDNVIGKYIGGPVRVDGHPRANGILDTIVVCKAHGIKVPPEFEDISVVETLETAVVQEWFAAYKQIEFKKLSMGRLIGDLKATLQKKIDDPEEKTNKLRLAINSCHDTSVGGILNALDVFNSRWPPFTSHLSFELLRSTSKPSFLSSLVPSFLHSAPSRPHYVRLRFNAKPLAIPTCKKAGMHLAGTNGEVCTWEGFLEAVKNVEMSGKDWEKGCV